LEFRRVLFRSESSAFAETSDEHVQADHEFPDPLIKLPDGLNPKYAAFQNLWWSMGRLHPDQCLCLPDRPDSLRYFPISAYWHIRNNPDRHVSAFCLPVQNPAAWPAATASPDWPTDKY